MSADGSTETGDVAAGSGYYSESSPACFFGYADGAPPTSIRVHWPAGATTEYPFTPNSTSLVLGPPQP